MAYTRTAQPDDDALLTLDRIKEQCRISHDTEDDLLAELRQAAREYCEDYVGRSFMPQTWVRTLDRFPCRREIYLRYPPLISIEGITYYDAAGELQTMDADDYIVDTASYRGRVALAPEASWPVTQCGRVNAVAIEFQAGYEDEDAVPGRIKLAMLMLINHHYDRRTPIIIGAMPAELQLSFAALLATLKVFDRDED